MHAHYDLPPRYVAFCVYLGKGRYIFNEVLVILTKKLKCLPVLLNRLQNVFKNLLS